MDCWKWFSHGGGFQSCISRTIVLWGPVDLGAMGDHVVVASPGQFNPFIGASEIMVVAPDCGTIRLVGGHASHGEGPRLVRGCNGRLREVWLGGTKFFPEARAKPDLKRRYERRW